MVKAGYVNCRTFTAKGYDIVDNVYMQRAWAEVNLDAIAANLHSIRAKLTNPSTKIMAVVKADAYGHGFLQVTKTLLENKADALGVAVLDEAKQLRSRGIDVPILILGKTNIEAAEDIIDFDVMPTVFSYEIAKALSDTAVKKRKDVRIHIKIDTGMTRLGYMYHGEADAAVIDEIERISRLPYLVIDGIFTHLACADETDEAYTRLQFGRFTELCGKLKECGVDVGTRHVCNSAGLVMYPEMQLDMVRPGIILYGLHPSELTGRSIELTPAMSLKARVTMVKTVDSGVGISYGKEYETHGKTVIATVPVGYADGYSRLLAGKAGMIAGEKLVPVVGRICMDQCMVDVTNVYNISEGDTVTIMGADGGQSITADDLAGYMGTINYEVVCIIGKRIPRVYVSGGNVVRALNSLV